MNFLFPNTVSHRALSQCCASETCKAPVRQLVMKQSSYSARWFRTQKTLFARQTRRKYPFGLKKTSLTTELRERVLRLGPPKPTDGGHNESVAGHMGKRPETTQDANQTGSSQWQPRKQKPERTSRRMQAAQHRRPQSRGELAGTWSDHCAAVRPGSCCEGEGQGAEQGGGQGGARGGACKASLEAFSPRLF